MTGFLTLGLCFFVLLRCVSSFSQGYFRTFHDDQPANENVIFMRLNSKHLRGSPKNKGHAAGALAGQMADNACQMCQNLKKDFIYKRCVINHCSKVD